MLVEGMPLGWNEFIRGWPRIQEKNIEVTSTREAAILAVEYRELAGNRLVELACCCKIEAKGFCMCVKLFLRTQPWGG